MLQTVVREKKNIVWKKKDVIRDTLTLLPPLFSFFNLLCVLFHKYVYKF